MITLAVLSSSQQMARKQCLPATALWLLWRLPAEDNDSLQGIATRFEGDRTLHFLVDIMCRWNSGFVSGAEHL